MLTHIQQMLEISRPIKESWLNFYEGYDDDIDGEYSTATEAVEKKGEKLVAKNATGRRMLKILNKKVNEYLISLEPNLYIYKIFMQNRHLLGILSQRNQTHLILVDFDFN